MYHESYTIALVSIARAELYLVMFSVCCICKLHALLLPLAAQCVLGRIKFQNKYNLWEGLSCRKLSQAQQLAILESVSCWGDTTLRYPASNTGVG